MFWLAEADLIIALASRGEQQGTARTVAGVGVLVQPTSDTGPAAARLEANDGCCVVASLAGHAVWLCGVDESGLNTEAFFGGAKDAAWQVRNGSASGVVTLQALAWLS